LTEVVGTENYITRTTIEKYLSTCDGENGSYPVSP
jgi:hypothetical protein